MVVMGKIAIQSQMEMGMEKSQHYVMAFIGWIKCRMTCMKVKLSCNSNKMGMLKSPQQKNSYDMHQLDTRSTWYIASWDEIIAWQRWVLSCYSSCKPFESENNEQNLRACTCCFTPPPPPPPPPPHKGKMWTEKWHERGGTTTQNGINELQERGGGKKTCHNFLNTKRITDLSRKMQQHTCPSRDV